MQSMPPPSVLSVPSQQPELVMQLVARIEALEAHKLRLEADVLRLRGSVVQRDSALAFARQDQQALADAVPGLRSRVELARKVESMGEQLQSLMRDRLPRPGL